MTTPKAEDEAQKAEGEAQADTCATPSSSTNPEPDPPPSRRSRLLRAAGWTTIGNFLAQAIGLSSSLILTRLLAPEVYGLMELVLVFNIGIAMFTDLGQTANVIQSKRGDDPVFLNTSWTIGIIRGGIIFVASLLLAYPIGVYYEEPDLAYLLPAQAFSWLIASCASTSLDTQARQMRLGSVVGIELGTQVVTLTVQILIALVWPTVWTFIIGSWIGNSLKVYGSFAFLPGIKHRLTWERAAVKELLGFGKWILLSTALSYVSTQGDKLLFGKLLTKADLGVYAVATRLRMAIQGLHGRLVRSVILPLISERARELGDENREAARELSRLYYKARLGLDALFVTAAGGLSTFGDTFLGILYPAEFEMAGEILEILAIDIGLNSALWSTEAILTGMGHTQHYFVRSLGRTVFVLVAFPLGWYFAGFWGVIWMVAFTETPTLIIYWRELIQRNLFSLWGELRPLFFFAAGALLGLGVDRLVLWMLA